MKTIVFISLALMAQASFAAVTLPWTNTSNSVQGILFDALYQYRETHEDAVSLVTVDVLGKLTVKDDEAQVSCTARALSMAMVQSYRCVFSQKELPRTLSSLSVQATLWKALHNLKQMDENSAYTQGLVKSAKGGVLIVQDNEAKLTCTARSMGAMPAQTYQCSLQTK